MGGFLDTLFFWRKPKAVVMASQDRAGPSPWYLKTGEGFSTTKQDYRWKHDSGKSGSGLVKLLNSNGRVVLILDFQWYVRRIDETRLLLWHDYQCKPEEAQNSRLEFRVVDLDELKEFPNALVAVKRVRENKESIGLADTSGLISTFSTHALNEGRHQILPPVAFSGIEEVLALADYQDDDGPSDYWGKMRRAIYAVNFKLKQIDVYPQDWFNKSNLDFGYQWITRVWRREDGRIEGNGIRIDSFILDSTCKQLGRR